MHTSFISGFLSGLVLIIAIGAQNAFVLRQGLRREHLLPVAMICAASDALLVAAGIAGLGVLIQTNPVLLTVARYGGALFLLGYAVVAARRAWKGEHMTVNDRQPLSRAAAVTTCLAFTFLNPHVYLDTVVLLGSIANQHGEAGRWVFGGGAASASFVWFFGLAYGARVLTPVFANPRAWRILDTIIALVMVGLALSLLR